MEKTTMVYVYHGDAAPYPMPRPKFPNIFQMGESKKIDWSYDPISDTLIIYYDWNR